MKNLLDKIIIDPKVMVGKAIIKGTRMTVQQIFGLFAQGATIEDILGEYPHLLRDDIYACFLFAQQALDNNEAWLFLPENREMLESVKRGLKQKAAAKWSSVKKNYE